MATKRVTARAGSAHGGAAWQRVVRVIGQKVIEPDPRIVDAFRNTGYSLEAAIADLVDNSIDANASRVLIRFMRTESELLSLIVVDDGDGMTEKAMDRAMQFAGRREYSGSDLGMYGMGLKSASLSQADNFTVASRAKGGSAVGRRWTESQAKSGWVCDIVDPTSAAEELDRAWDDDLELSVKGTVVRWDGVRDFQKASGRVDSYLRKVRQAILNHLGLQLHRFIEQGRVAIVVDAENVETGELGFPAEAVALDPFGYDMVGAGGYPKKFQVDIPTAGILHVTAHIWPARSKLPGYKLGGGNVSRRQGLYFYRNDRLIQAGGWNNLRDDAEPHMSLARVEVDLPVELESFFSIRFSKSGVDAPRSFADALAASVADDGTTFPQFLDRAQEVYRTKAEPALKPVLPGGKGLTADVRRTISENLPVYPEEYAVTFLWERLPKDVFFRVDRDDCAITLNSIYRKAVLAGAKASAADAPLVKALLLLLLNDNLCSQRESAVEKATLAAWQAIMVAAVR